MATESASFRVQAKRAYEVGRLRHAAAWSVPTLVLGGVVAMLVNDVSVPLLLSAVLFLASVGLLWWGRAPGRGVLPGVACGLLPLGGGVIGKLHGHVCLGASCYGVCMLLCVGGGVLAGLVIARIAARSQNPLVVFFSAAATALFTGAMGSSCVGVHGIIGMGLGIGLGVFPMMAFRRHAVAGAGHHRDN
jgi:hypothetical protein